MMNHGGRFKDAPDITPHFNVVLPKGMMIVNRFNGFPDRFTGITQGTMIFAKLPRSFYLRPTLTVAKDLLGKHLVRKSGRTLLVGKIVEVEAYLGDRDPASHAYRGKTKRNEVMFRTGGHLYVYFTYGMHYCANVVTGKEGTGHAVLIRAIEPVSGLAAMRKNRKPPAGGTQQFGMTNGPAKLCQALGIERIDNGTDLLGDDIFLARRTPSSPLTIGRSPRIGITKARHHPWRFFLKGNPWISR
jgi:DNA-3-methyladenine glycosylase